MEKSEEMDRTALIKKYNVPVPRYTSYPTVPLWEHPDNLPKEWQKTVLRTFRETNREKGISIYIHLPFCESLCTYCGCTQHITRNHQVEDAYIDALLKEWHNYLEIFDEKPNIREMHLGGGTPTFFSPQNLQRLLTGILESNAGAFEAEYSFEGHPNNTKKEHLQELYDLGFRRVSFGVQDFDLKVQSTINRIQPYQHVVRVTEEARQIGYRSVNFDLVYGLPFQTIEVIEDTFKKVLSLVPERVAFYSYAHVPWKRPGQRKYTESDLPDNEYKRVLYETGNAILRDAGYHEIGMDHFALEHDDLFKAYRNKTLHRNFMGYTVCNTELMIGLGMSSISDAKYAYAQNLKKVRDYEQALMTGGNTVFAGHLLTDEDLRIRKLIKDLICLGEIQWNGVTPDYLPSANQKRLKEMVEEGIIMYDQEGLKLTEFGKPFIRNVCHIFDARHWSHLEESKKRYSKSI